VTGPSINGWGSVVIFARPSRLCSWRPCAVHRASAGYPGKGSDCMKIGANSPSRRLEMHNVFALSLVWKDQANAVQAAQNSP